MIYPQYGGGGGAWCMVRDACAHAYAHALKPQNTLFVQDGHVLEDFQHFVSVNAHLFVEKPVPDLIQLSLSEPTDSEVYKQALEEATKCAREGALYLKWWYGQLLSFGSVFRKCDYFL